MSIYSHKQEQSINQTEIRQNAFMSLLSSLEAVKVISKKSLDELRTYINPPTDIQNVMEALCLILNVETKWSSQGKC